MSYVDGLTQLISTLGIGGGIAVYLVMWMTRNFNGKMNKMIEKIEELNEKIEKLNNNIEKLIWVIERVGDKEDK